MNDLNAKFIYNKKCEQSQGVDCGIFALKNMEIMAYQLLINSEAFIKGFQKFPGFCRLQAARELRREKFAELYLLGEYEAIRLQGLNKKKRALIREHHYPESEMIVRVLKGNHTFRGLTIYALKPEEDFDKERQNLIGIEIATDPYSLRCAVRYHYSFHIHISKNLLGNLQLRQSIIESLRIENEAVDESGTIKIQYDRLNVIPKKEQLSLIDVQYFLILKNS